MTTKEGYELVNQAKLDRVMEQLGADASEADILANYDKLGGLIRKEGQQIKIGCFWDVKAKKPFAEPKIVYVYSVNGSLVEVPEGTELPGQVRAARILEEEATKKTAGTVAKKRGKKTAEDEQASDEDE